MKRQTCITLDEETHSKIQRELGKAGKKFRSKSHFIEVAVEKMLETEVEE